MSPWVRSQGGTHATGYPPIAKAARERWDIAPGPASSTEKPLFGVALSPLRHRTPTARKGPARYHVTAASTGSPWPASPQIAMKKSQAPALSPRPCRAVTARERLRSHPAPASSTAPSPSCCAAAISAERTGGQRLQLSRLAELLPNPRAGVTLLEMLIVVAIIATLASISFPSLISGLAGIRLSSSAGDVASFFTSSMNRVERREQAAAIVVEPAKNRIVVFTAISGDKPASELNLPPGILIDAQDSARYMIYPGGAFPRISLILKNEKGARRRISIDPVTAVPKIERVEVTP